MESGRLRFLDTLQRTNNCIHKLVSFIFFFKTLVCAFIEKAVFFSRVSKNDSFLTRHIPLPSGRMVDRDGITSTVVVDTETTEILVVSILLRPTTSGVRICP